MQKTFCNFDFRQNLLSYLFYLLEKEKFKGFTGVQIRKGDEQRTNTTRLPSGGLSE